MIEFIGRITKRKKISRHNIRRCHKNNSRMLMWLMMKFMMQLLQDRKLRSEQATYQDLGL